MNSKYYPTVQPTRTGTFILRAVDGRELGQYPSQDECERARGEYIARVEATAAELAQAHQEQREWDLAHAQTFEAQIHWEKWRNWFYNELVHQDNHLVQRQRALDNVPSGDIGQFGTTGSPTYNTRVREFLRDATQQQEARELYEHMVALDTRIKTARRNRNASELETLLGQAETLIHEMRKFFYWVARPE